MYGLITSMLVMPENREALLSLLASGASDLPGRVSYVIAADAEDPSLVWVTEAWESAQSQSSSLDLSHVKEAAAAAKRVVLGFGTRVETEPISVG